MSDIKWIKITTDMFDNRKVKHLRKLPSGDSIVLIWVMLLTMAGRCNAGGMIFLTENIPYTNKMLADELDFEENIINLALQSLEQLGMICYHDEYFAIAGWEEYQNIDGMERVREQNRLRKQRQRENEKQLLIQRDDNEDFMSRDTSRDVTQQNKNKNKDKDIKEKEIDKEKEKTSRIDYESILQLYNSCCPSLPRVMTLSDSRRKAIKARLNSYTFDDFQTLFDMAEASDFLKGRNDRNWMANFDWLIKDANMAKVLDGNYSNKTGDPTKPSQGFGTKTWEI